MWCPTLGPACSELMGSLDTHPVSRLLWRRLKPLVLGKVLFAPDTPFTRQLMTQVREQAGKQDLEEVGVCRDVGMCQLRDTGWSRGEEAGGGPRHPQKRPGWRDLSTHLLQVNRTFQELALLKDIQEVWGLLGSQLFAFMNDSANVAMLQVGTGWRAANSPTASPSTSPSPEDLGQGQGLLGKGVEVGHGVHGELRMQGWEEGATAPKCLIQTPTFPHTPQRLLQIQDKGSRQPGPRGRDQVEALRAFLNPRSGSYSWQEALADVGHLVGTLGRVMEVRGHPVEGISAGRGSPAGGGHFSEEAQLHGSALRSREDPGTSDPCLDPSVVRDPGQAGGCALGGCPGGAGPGANLRAPFLGWHCLPGT